MIIPGHIFDYEAFGQLLSHTPEQAAALLTNILFSGEQVDARTGLSYLRGRYYDLATGRFTRLDPFAGEPAIPLSLHKYLYVHGNPIGGVDPSGRSLVEQLQTVAIRSILISAITVPVGAVLSVASGNSIVSGMLAGGQLGAGLSIALARGNLTEVLISGTVALALDSWAKSISSGRHGPAPFDLLNSEFVAFSEAVYEESVSTNSVLATIALGLGSSVAHSFSATFDALKRGEKVDSAELIVPAITGFLTNLLFSPPVGLSRALGNRFRKVVELLHEHSGRPINEAEQILNEYMTTTFSSVFTQVLSMATGAIAAVSGREIDRNDGRII